MTQSQYASNSFENFKTKVTLQSTETLKSLEFAVQSLPEMAHQQLGSNRTDQKAIDADALRWLIQRELDARKAGELLYSWGEMYLAMGIPKEFLKQ